MSTDEEIRGYLRTLSASDFDVAVARLINAGIHPEAARQLINNATDWPGALSSWADHLIEQKRQYQLLEERFPRGSHR